MDDKDMEESQEEDTKEHGLQEIRHGHEEYGIGEYNSKDPEEPRAQIVQ